MPNDVQTTSDVPAAATATSETPKPPIVDVAGPINEKEGIQVVSNEQLLISFKQRTDKAGNKLPKRPNFYLTAPMPTWLGIVSVAGDSDNPELAKKAQQFLTSLVREAVISAVRAQVDDPLNPIDTQDDLSLDDLTFAKLAQETENTRRSSAIPKETWDNFRSDYTLVMMQAGKSESACKNALKILTSRFNGYKGQRLVIDKLMENLNIYLNKTEKTEEFSDLVELLIKLGEDAKNVSEENTLNLL